MKRTFKSLTTLLAVSLILVASCKNFSQNQINKETPTRGNIKIGVDEAYQLLADAEIDVFENIYPYAHITPISASEDSVLKLFMADSVRLMITSRKLTSNEEAYLKENLIIPRTTHIAWDAIAFVINKSNQDQKIRYNTIHSIFTGDVNNWKQINSASKLGPIQVVFDNQGSSNIRFIMNKFGLKTLPANCFAANSNPAVIDYVEKNPGAIGVISVNWVSDPDDSITHDFLSRIGVVAISHEVFSEGDEFYTPHPAYIAQKNYPFIREVYAISRESFEGLGRGFIQFVAFDSGQRIILKMGMLPATMPVRLVNFRKGDLSSK
jgi:phosphate transport system substrate-binding protein